MRGLDKNFAADGKFTFLGAFVKLSFGQSVIGINMVCSFLQDLFGQVESRFYGAILIKVVFSVREMLKGKMRVYLRTPDTHGLLLEYRV